MHLRGWEVRLLAFAVEQDSAAAVFQLWAAASIDIVTQDGGEVRRQLRSAGGLRALHRDPPS